jgi:hypothetical protein
MELEHLLTQDYIQLTKQEATARMDTLRKDLKLLIKNNETFFSQAEVTFFNRSLKTRFRLPIFYGLPKVHKTPMSLQPVVSGVNSLLAVFSTWLDYKMKSLLPLIQSYLKNSTSLINEIKHIELPRNTLVFTADAKSMYTNIDTDAGIAAIIDLLNSNKDKLPPDFLSELFLQILSIVMRNNIFSIGETHWLQLSGTAMGTPAACAYATITYGHFENKYLLPAFKKNLIYYRRYIDDVFGIWVPPTLSAQSTWNNFKECMNNWHNLQWEIEEPTISTHFLDLNITIQGSQLTFSTFQKPLNLYLYIPPLSAHPHSCFKGLIKGELNRYWLQNSTSTFQELVTKFIERLTMRGHTLESLRPILTQAAMTLHPEAIARSSSTSDTEDTLFIHLRHHPKGLQQSDIRRIYNETLSKFNIHDKMTVAISRPKNLRDVLTKTSLILPREKTVEDFISKLKAHPQAAPN